MTTEYQAKNITISNGVQKTGPVYAAEFAKLTGKVWSYVDPRNPADSESSHYAHSYVIRENESGLALLIYVDVHKNKATCSPSLPNLPDGGPYGRRTAWRDWSFIGSTGEQIRETPEAGVSGERFYSAPAACAKRFYTMVYLPYLAVFPQVAIKVAEQSAGYAKMEEVTLTLVSEFKGRVSTNHHQDSTRTVYFEGRIPSVTVSQWGHLRVEHPSFTLDTFRAYARAVLSSKES